MDHDSIFFICGFCAAGIKLCHSLGHGHWHIRTRLAFLQNARGGAKQQTLELTAARKSNSLVDLKETPNALKRQRHGINDHSGTSTVRTFQSQIEWGILPSSIAQFISDSPLVVAKRTNPVCWISPLLSGLHNPHETIKFPCFKNQIPLFQKPAPPPADMTENASGWPHWNVSLPCPNSGSQTIPFWRGPPVLQRIADQTWSEASQCWNTRSTSTGLWWKWQRTWLACRSASQHKAPASCYRVGKLISNITIVTYKWDKLGILATCKIFEHLGLEQGLIFTVKQPATYKLTQVHATLPVLTTNSKHILEVDIAAMSFLFEMNNKLYSVSFFLTTSWLKKGKGTARSRAEFLQWQSDQAHGCKSFEPMTTPSETVAASLLRVFSQASKPETWWETQKFRNTSFSLGSWGSNFGVHDERFSSRNARGDVESKSARTEGAEA